MKVDRNSVRLIMIMLGGVVCKLMVDWSRDKIIMIWVKLVIIMRMEGVSDKIVNMVMS